MLKSLGGLYVVAKLTDDITLLTSHCLVGWLLIPGNLLFKFQLKVLSSYLLEIGGFLLLLLSNLLKLSSVNNESLLLSLLSLLELLSSSLIKSSLPVFCFNGALVGRYHLLM